MADCGLGIRVCSAASSCKVNGARGAQHGLFRLQAGQRRATILSLLTEREESRIAAI